MSDILREADGLLFIGDPHLTSIRPGRRTDANFGNAVLAKIEAAISVANERRLVPVFAGDIFDRPVEEDQSLITRLIRILGSCWTPSITNVGNHDMGNIALSDGDSLSILKAGGSLVVVTESGPVEEFLLGDERRRVGLGMTPYGQTIPKNVDGVFPLAETTVWLTHHDLLFKGFFSPKSVPLHEIAGCDVVINGHLHMLLPTEHRGRTAWHNPGNITRLTADAIDHMPAVWVFDGKNPLFEIQLPDPEGLFDMTGYNVEAASAVETAKAVREEASAFVEMLQTEKTMEMGKSDDGSLLREEIEAKCESAGIAGPVRVIVLALLDEAVARGAAA